MTDGEKTAKTGDAAAPGKPPEQALGKGSGECADRRKHPPSDGEIVSSGGSSTGAALRDQVGGTGKNA